MTMATPRVLVTGGAGFIGSHIVETLLDCGFEVAALDNLSSGRRENLPTGVHLYQVDINDPDALDKAVADFQPGVISHQAAQVSVAASVGDPSFDARTNIIGGLNVLDSARNNQVEQILFASTGGAIYGEVPEGETALEDWFPRPASPYAASKASFEYYLDVYRQQFGLEYATMRYANVYGPRQDPHGEAGVVAIFTERLMAGQPVSLFARRSAGDDGCLRDYVFVTDVARSNRVAIENRLTGIYNVGTGIMTTTRTVLHEIERAADRAADCTDADPRPGDLEASALNCDKLRQTGWAPLTDFATGIQQTLDWFCNQ